MFTRSSTAASRRPQRASRDKGLATLRIYNSADYPFGCIYEEAVIGAYKLSNGPDPIVITSGPGGKPLQQFSLSPQTRYARHLGSVPSTVRVLFDDTEAGGFFFVRNQKMLRFTNDQVKAAVFSNPVWFAERQGRPRPTAIAPPIPSGARMGRYSVFSEQAGDVAAILMSEETLPLFDIETGQPGKARPGI